MAKNKYLPKIKFFMIISAFLAICSNAMADDIEIYSNRTTAGVKPNILFLLDVSASMGGGITEEEPGKYKDYWVEAPTWCSTCPGYWVYRYVPNKLEILKSSLSQIITNPANSDKINMGLGFIGSQGGWYKNLYWPVSPLWDKAQNYESGTFSWWDVKNALYYVLMYNGTLIDGTTPIVWSMFNALNYFRGEPITDNSLTSRSLRPAPFAGLKYSTSSWSYRWGPQRSVYEPHVAWDPVPLHASWTSSCYDYTINTGPVFPHLDKNYCDGRDTFDCVVQEYDLVEHTQCDWVETVPGYCEKWDITETECLDWVDAIKHRPETCDVEDQISWTSGGYQRRYCKYERKDYGEWLPHKFISPFNAACQSNHLVIVTDGAPSNEPTGTTYGSTTSIREYIAKTKGIPVNEVVCEDLSTSIFGLPAGTYTYGNCGPELANFMANEEQSPNFSKNYIQTSAIGFGINPNLTGSAESIAYLKKITNEGKGWFFTAENGSELSAKFEELINEVVVDNESFTGMTTTVNASTLSTDNKAYVTMFLPNQGRSWDANVKGYTLGSTGLLDANGVPATEVNGDGSVSFKSSSRSYWTRFPDGNEVGVGGLRTAITNINMNWRKVFTFPHDYAPNNHSLATDPELALSASNDALTLEMLGLSSEVVIPSSLDPFKGTPVYDMFVEYYTTNWKAIVSNPLMSYLRYNVGLRDILHSKPTVINYGANTGHGENDREVIFVASNSGLLHAFDVSKPYNPAKNPGEAGSDEVHMGSWAWITTGDGYDYTETMNYYAGTGGTEPLLPGREMWAFMPKSMISNLISMQANEKTGSHLYGLDGQFSTWVEDVNEDGSIKAEDGDHAYIYLTMRRGGHQVFAFDVTNPNSPIYMWRIDGGENGTADFKGLGQTWSKPSVASMKINGTEKTVLVFGGGYDKEQDLMKNGRANDDIGNGIYIVEAKTGDLLYSGGGNNTMFQHQLHNKMTFSIPSDLRLIDSDYDGLTDRIYVGDLGGQVWRLDINESNIGSTSATLIADFSIGSESRPEHHRRFYSAPAVTLAEDSSAKVFQGIAIGSGYRANPLNSDNEDQFYFIKDYNIAKGNPASPSTLDQSDLYNATANEIGQGNENLSDPLNLTPAEESRIHQQKLDAIETLESKMGWYLKLDDHEKSLSEPMFFDGKIIFTTYAPIFAESEIEGCNLINSSGRMYVINIYDATPVNDLYTDDGHEGYLSSEDRYKTHYGASIPSKPVLVFKEGQSTVDIYVGKSIAGKEDQLIKTINWKSVK